MQWAAGHWLCPSAPTDKAGAASISLSRCLYATDRLVNKSLRVGLGVWSRSVGESAKLIPHSGRDYGPGTSRLRHDHARRPNCDTAIEGSAQGTSGAAWAEPQDSCQVA